jgi:hypothetical protein
MSNNMQATTAQALLAPEPRELEHTWRSWTRSTISAAKKRQAARGQHGVAVTMTSDGLMAKLRAASFRCVLSGVEFRNDGSGRFGPTIPTVERPSRPLQRQQHSRRLPRRRCPARPWLGERQRTGSPAGCLKTG